MDQIAQAHRPSRRAVLKTGALTLGLGAAAGVGVETSGAGANPPPATRPIEPVLTASAAAPEGSTLARTLRLGTADRSGYRRVVSAAGEAPLRRDDLLTTRERNRNGTALMAIAQLTDTHIVDAQSPNRLSYIDQYVTMREQGGALHPAFAGIYRPWEMLTAHVAEAMVHAVNALAGGPVTGRPLDFTITTGDNADSAQRNEIGWHIDLLDGNEVRPDSGDHRRWEGVGGPADSRDYYWHPDGPTRDTYRRDHGFPAVPGLLDRCRAPFRAQGLDTPWYAVFGNHDGLVFGMAQHEGDLDAVASGDVRRTGLPADASDHVLDALAVSDPAALREVLLHGPGEHVTADLDRHPARTNEIVAAYLQSSGRPHGHGFTTENLREDTAYYAFSHRGVRCISLDTVNPAGYYQGSLDPTQFAWLERELEAASSRHLSGRGRWVAGDGTDELVVIFSHHTSATMTNDRGGNRVLGPALLNLLLRYPNVIAWVNGHRHVNDVTPHARPTGWAAGSGLWEISTASHVDWPQQARTVEVVDNGGSVSVFTTVLDHAGPASWPRDPSSPIELAALARELSANDPHNALHLNPSSKPAGTRADRNVELLVDKPF